MDSDWMNDLTQKLNDVGIEVIRFEFPYMNERRENGKKRPPNTKKVLLETWTEVISKYARKSPLFIGGKSMGGRMATLLDEETLTKVNGIINFGFPFHAPGKEPKDRIDHLEKFKTPTLIHQGTRDSMGTLEEVKTYSLSKKLKFHWLEDGDHSLKPRVKSGHSLDEHLLKVAQESVKFISKQTKK